MFGAKLLWILFCVAALHIVDTEGIVFTDGTTLTKEFADGTTAGTTFELTTDVDATFALTGTDAASFSVAPLAAGTAGKTATITIKGALDHATKPTYSFTVTANAGDDTATTIAVTVNIVLVFASKEYGATVCETATEGDRVITVTSIPIKGRTVTYSITGGNTDTTFEISPANGVISLAAGKTVDKKVTPVYTLTVTATDNSNTPQTDTATVTVIVLCSSGTSTITGSLAAVLCLVFCVFKKLF